MKLSTRGRYGVKAMIDLAVHCENNNCVSLKSIAQRQGISENYLEQLMAALKKAQIVKSIRGAQGGYILNKPCNEISVGDLLRVLEGPLELVDCIFDSSAQPCGNANCQKCVTKNVWERMSESVTDVVDSITLSELVNDYKKINK